MRHIVTAVKDLFGAVPNPSAQGGTFYLLRPNDYNYTHPTRHSTNPAGTGRSSRFSMNSVGGPDAISSVNRCDKV